MKLNGWQRLWVLTGVIYAIPVFLLSASDFPTEKSLYNNWADTLSTYQPYSDLFLPNYAGYNPNQDPLINQKKILLWEEQLRQKSLHPELNSSTKSGCEGSGGYQCAIDLRNLYTDKLNHLFNDQIKYISGVFLIWFVPMIIIYIFGSAIGWVYRGFKGNR